MSFSFQLFKIYIYLITPFGLLFSSFNISGYIFDADTNKPIQNAQIFEINNNFGTTSDINGYFLLTFTAKAINDNEISEINLAIRVIGYDHKELLIDSMTYCLKCNNSRADLGKIFLKPKSIELNSIDIKSDIDESNQISDIQISGKELGENLKGNIATTLSNQPNIGINSFGIVTSKPSLRGFSGDRFLLTKDGDETGDLSQSSIDHVIALDMTEINEIEIIRGPRSLVYGPNTIGGVVNTGLLGDPKVRFKKFKKHFLIGNDSYNSGLYGNMMLYMPYKNSQLNLFLSQRETGNQQSPDGELENTQSLTEIYKLGFTRYAKRGFLNLQYENYNMSYGIPPYPNAHEDGVDILLLKNSYLINYHRDLNLKNFSQLNFKYNFIDYVHIEMVNDDENTNDIQEYLDDGNFHVSLAKITKNYKIELSGKKILYGLELTEREFNPAGFYLTPITNEKRSSIYGFHEFTFKKLGIDLQSSFRLGQLLVNPGQYDIDSQAANLILKDSEGNPILDENGNKISLVEDKEFYNLSLSFGIRKVVDNIEFNSWFMHTMRPPRVEELFSDGPHLASYAFEIGNPNLKSERIYGIENSMKYKSDKQSMSIVTFYNYSPYYFEMTKDGLCEIPEDWQPWTTHPCYGADYIDWGSGAMGWLHKYSSKGSEVVIKGYEFDWQYYFDNMHLKYSLSFVQGDSKTTEMPLSYISPMKQILTFDFIRKNVNYKLRLTNIDAQNRTGEFETSTPETFLTDFVYTFNFEAHSLTLQLNNIFDKTYYNHLSRIKDLKPEPGASIHFNYKVIF